MRLYNIIKEFSLNEKESYFVSYYLYRLKLYESGSSEFEMFNLHSLCEIIIEEIMNNNINRNLKFFQDKLRNISRIDYMIKNNYEYKVNEIINNITSNKQYALIVAKNLITELNEGKYGKEICYRISKLIFSKKELENIKVELNYLIDALIIEYVIYGYDLKEIEDIIYNIFSKYQIIDSKRVITNFPIPEGTNDNEKIINFINDLSIQKRIDTLKLYFEQKKRKFYYMFNMRGIVGDFLDIHLNNVDIYNWKTKYKFGIEIQKDKPAMYSAGNFEKNDIHCSIMIESVGKDSKFEKVKQELDDALDILSFYHNIQCKIEVDYSKYVIFDENREFIGEGMTNEFKENFKREVKPLNYNYNKSNDEVNEEYNKYSKYILNNFSYSSRIIKQSIRYYKKAKEATRLEDKILDYWICIENIFNAINIDIPNSILDKNEKDSKFNKIYSLIPYITLKNRLILVYWKVYEFFMNSDRYARNFNLKILTDDEMKKLQFNGEEINLIDFIKYYEILDNKFNLEIIQDIYLKYNKMLTDARITTDYINKSIRKSKDILLILYRYRNMIVHNAQYDITFSKFYIKQFDLIASMLLNTIINEYYINEGNKKLEDIIIYQYTNNKQLAIILKSETLKNWFLNQ